jgi:hypothetical protein
VAEAAQVGRERKLVARRDGLEVRDRELDERRHEQMFAVKHSARKYPDLAELVDYRAYEGAWGFGFESWLKPRLQELGFVHVRFFGGDRCEYDGSFRNRVCELRSPGEAVRYYVYG